MEKPDITKELVNFKEKEVNFAENNSSGATDVSIPENSVLKKYKDFICLDIARGIPYIPWVQTDFLLSSDGTYLAIHGFSKQEMYVN